MNTTSRSVMNSDIAPGGPVALPSPRTVLAVGLLVATVAGLVASQGAGGYVGDAELVLLLRFMGVIKLATAAVAAALLAWRLRLPLSRGLRLVAIVASWCLALGATLITCLAYIIPATGLFHLGLLALFVVALLEGRPVRR